MLMFKQLKGKIKHEYDVFSQAFVKNILAGYMIYSRIIRQYGKDAKLYLTGFNNAYSCGLLFNAFCSELPIEELPIFCVCEENGREEAEILSIKSIEMLTQDEMGDLYCLFMFADKRRLILLNHNILNYLFINSNIYGYKGLNYINGEWWCSYPNILINKRQEPTFDYGDTVKIFEEFSLIPGRTVLLTPQIKEVIPVPNWFWFFLAEALEEKGFIVCTYCESNDKPIDGTKAVTFSLKKAVPFVEMAGTTIGNRNAFQDVTESAKCLKIAIYYDFVENFKPSLTSNIKDFFTLTVYNEQDQYEFEYTRRGEVALIDKLVKMVISYSEGQGA